MARGWGRHTRPGSIGSGHLPGRCSTGARAWRAGAGRCTVPGRALPHAGVAQTGLGERSSLWPGIPPAWRRAVPPAWRRAVPPAWRPAVRRRAVMQHAPVRPAGVRRAAVRAAVLRPAAQGGERQGAALRSGCRLTPAAGRGVVNDLPGLGRGEVGRRLAHRQSGVIGVEVPGLGRPARRMPGLSMARFGAGVPGTGAAMTNRTRAARCLPGAGRPRTCRAGAVPSGRPVPGRELPGRVQRRRLSWRRRETAKRALAGRPARRPVPPATGRARADERPVATRLVLVFLRLPSGRTSPPGRALPTARRPPRSALTRVPHAASVSPRSPPDRRSYGCPCAPHPD
jgi:hypothetical protein